MKYTIIILGGLFLVLIGLIMFFYFQFEKPAKIELESKTITFNIMAIDYTNETQIITGYTTSVDGVVTDSQKTLIDGRILFTAFINKSIQICNKNLENQYYYVSCYNKNINDLTPDSNRVNLMLYSPGILNITADSLLGQKDIVILNVSSDKLYKKAIFCLKWSSHLYSVNTKFKSIIKPEAYYIYDKCYDLEKDITNIPALIPINYQVIDNVDSQDYIRVILIDRDDMLNINNIGGEDVIYDII